jgi:hypothetical protein
MTCDKCMDRYLSLDNGEELPFGVCAHVAHCDRCAAEIRRFESALEAMLESAPDPERDLIPSIMLEIAVTAPEGHTVSFGRWIAVGCTLLLSVVLVPFGDSFGWASAVYGSKFQFPLFLVLGLVLAVYCTVFIGTHVEEIERRLKFFRHIPR